jgi:hypothetical protein
MSIDGESSPLFDQLLEEQKDPFVISSHLKGAIHDAWNWEPKGPEDVYWCGWYPGRVDTPEQELQLAALGGRPGGDTRDREVLPRPGTRAGRIPAGSARSKHPRRSPRTKRAADGAGSTEATADRARSADGSASRVSSEAQEGS